MSMLNVLSVTDFCGLGDRSGSGIEALYFNAYGYSEGFGSDFYINNPELIPRSDKCGRPIGCILFPNEISEAAGYSSMTTLVYLDSDEWVKGVWNDFIFSTPLVDWFVAVPQTIDCFEDAKP
jgi:hypothetical protein